MPATRRETDSMGAVEVPADRLWGAQTQRSLEHFPIGRERYVWGRPMIRALGVLKKAAALANVELGALPADLGAAIAEAAQEVIDGGLDQEFPLVVFQTGSGTQSNMNANEVIAHLASRKLGRPVHPNDHVNRSQSSNDTFPTAMHIAVVAEARRLAPALAGLRATFEEKAEAFADVVKTGRTHLQDATPITLGQEISAWAAQLAFAEKAISDALEGVYDLAIGGTAVGTGLNAPARFGEVCALQIAELTREPFRSAANKFFALSAHDALAQVSAALRTLAGAAMKIANDVRWLASGPRCGIGEIRIPENEPGSSIMPGKVNPTQCEAQTMVAVQVYGNDAAVAFAASQGNFQLNVFKPVMASNVLDSLSLLTDALAAFDAHCARGIEPNMAVIERHLRDNLMLVTALNPHIGYDRAAKIAKAALAEGLTLREAATAAGVKGEDFDAWVDAKAMTKAS
jgi:fumarate hydratase class II